MSPPTTRAACASDLEAIAALHAKALGPGRFARSAYRVREGTPASTPYCRVSLVDGRIVAALRMTCVRIGGKPGALMLGPLAVDPAFAGKGHGRRLIMEALDEARSNGIELVVLVGDEPYYGRFGFKPVPPGQISLPGPVNPRRLLAVELGADALSHFRGVVEGSA